MIFSICKSLKSSVFCGENFRKTSKGMFHSLGESNKPKLSKIDNFRHKIELFSWISKKFACVRFPSCTHSHSYTKIGLFPLRLSLNYFFSRDSDLTTSVVCLSVCTYMRHQNPLIINKSSFISRQSVIHQFFI